MQTERKLTPERGQPISEGVPDSGAVLDGAPPAQRTGLGEIASAVRARALEPGSPVLLVVALVGLLIVFAILLSDTGFLTSSNLLNIVRQTAPITVMAVATVFVISAGEIDLSFASIPPVSGLVAAVMMENGNGIVLAVLAALAVGLLVGTLNGAITVGLGIPSFIVTLGMIGVLEGVARLVHGQQAVPIVNETFTSVFGLGDAGPFPALLLWTIAVGIGGAIVLRKTPFGKAVLATGGNETAARFSGIATGRVKLAALMLSGVAGALAGLLYSGQLASARYDLGSTDLLTVLAAVIIGGTALTGGRGSVLGAVAGSLLLGLVNNGVVLLGFSTPEQRIFTGLIVVAAVMLSAPKLLARWSGR